MRRRVGPLLFGVAVGALFVAERMWPLRRSKDPAPARVPRSLTIGPLDVPQETITIGVDGFLEPEEVTLERSLTLPFRRETRLLPPAAKRDDDRRTGREEGRALCAWEFWP